MRRKKEAPECPVITCVRLTGSKWKLLIIRTLLDGAQRFTEIKKSVPGINQKTLTENLRALERDGLVLREEFAGVPPCVVYSLTELGSALRPLFIAMHDWGEQYREATNQKSAKR